VFFVRFAAQASPLSAGFRRASGESVPELRIHRG
jgi:hypothetical protein